MMLRYLAILFFLSASVSSASGATPAEIAALKSRKPVELPDSGPRGSLSERLYKRMVKAQVLLGDQKYAEALELLERLKVSTKSKPFALAQVYQTIGYVYAQQSKYQPARENLQKCLDQNALPLPATLNTMTTLAQLYMAEGQGAKAIPVLQDVLFNAEEVKPRTLITLAQAWASLKQYREALKPLDKALKLATEPQESWYQLKVAMEYELKNYSAAAETLLLLVKMNPGKKKYWKQLSSIFLADGRKDTEALAVLELYEKRGFMSEEKEYLRLAHLYMNGNIPLKAAAVMERGLKAGVLKKTEKNYRITAQAWALAHEPEKALQALGKAAPMAKTGAVYVQQGNIYLEQEKWDKAAKALTRGLEKGGLKKPGKVWLALGIARFRLDKPRDALAAFETARDTKTAKVQADQWITHLEAVGR